MATLGKRPEKVRKQFVNSSHPYIILRFEDGHEIRIRKGKGKRFDTWPGETIQLLAVHDTNSGERELLEKRRSDAFDDANDEPMDEEK